MTAEGLSITARQRELEGFQGREVIKGRTSPNSALPGPSPATYRIAVITTTINVPTLLEAYVQNFRHFDRGSIEAIVVLDRKTPLEAEPFCREVSRRYGIAITCLTVSDQKAFLSNYPEFDRIIPWNTIQRRNVGYLYAVEQGFDFVITIDDDNFLDSSEDFIGSHIDGLGREAEVLTVDSSTGWFNCIDLLETNFGRVYPRGFPLSKRWSKNADNNFQRESKRCVVNAGLWVGDPDVDAITRIYYPVETRGPLKHEYVAMNSHTWCPVNSQNTAFHRDALPAAFLIVMGDEVGGIPISRYDDIWMGWILQSITEHMGDSVRFGRPLVRQIRNTHNLMNDLRGELPGMELNEEFINACRTCEFKSTSYLESYRELSAHISKVFSNHRHASLLQDVAHQMDVWADAVECAEKKRKGILSKGSLNA